MDSEWGMPDSYNHMRSVPINTTADRSLAEKVRELGKIDPDHRPAITPMKITEDGRMLRFALDVHGVGTIEMLVDGDSKTGKLIYKGMKICRGTK